MSPTTIAILANVISALLWSSVGATTKTLLISFSPFTLAFIRFAIATTVLLPFFLKEKISITNTFLKRVVPLAFLSTVNVTFFYFGLQRTTATASTLIYAAIPLLAVVFAVFFIKESITKQKLSGILVGFLGVIFIVLVPLFEKGTKVNGDFWGNILIFLGAVAWSLYTVGSRYLTTKHHYSPLTLTFTSFFISVIVFPLLLTIFPVNSVSLPISPLNVLLLLYLGIMLTAVTVILYQVAIKHSSATTASLNIYIQLVFSIALNILILGEKLTLGYIIGSLLVITGILLASGNHLSTLKKSQSKA